jgi:radical SAM superfamily enzyme YgiQ (UPF0313 family)
MDLIQPIRHSQFVGQAPMAKHAPGKRLLLVDPYPRNNPYRLTASERRAVWFPKLSLPVIAAYTPENWEVNLVDEAVQDIDFDYPCDMVGLSIMTCYAPRAYEIATEFRKRGKTIVMGGVHPTYCPDEALRYADAIVCGEAEDLWPQLVADYEAGMMQRMYKMTSFPSLERYKSPRVELLSPDSYMTRQCSFTTRGCHFDCEFCSVSPFNGKTTRRRPVPEVITELRNVQRWIRSELVERLRDEPMWNAFVTALRIRVGIEDGSIVAFVDDLHNSNRTYCRELWAALKPLKIKWGCQSTMFLADDEEMVKLAAESGCVSVFVGMESLDEEALDETNKPFNRVQKFSREIKMFHDYGIMVNPGIVFGFDSDDVTVFERAVDFLTKNQVELAYLNVLTPLPGTALFERFEKAGRIFDKNWAKYDAQQLMFQIKAKRHDKFAALFVDLDGTLDRLNALELIKWIKEAANHARMDIIVNFEHLKLATPDALKELMDSDAMKVAIPNVKVCFLKLKDAFESSMQSFSLSGLQGFSLAGLEHLNEDSQDA